MNIETLNKKFADLTVALIDDIQIVQDELGLQEISPEILEQIRKNVLFINAIEEQALIDSIMEDEDI